METTAKDYIFLTDKLDSLITSRPNFVAFRFLHEIKEGYVSLTYKELGRKAKTLAFVLKEKTASGDKALLLYPSGVDFIIAFFACLYADIIPVLAYPPDSENIDRLITIADDCNPDLVLCTNSVLSTLDDFESKTRIQDFTEMERKRKLKALYDLPWVPSDVIKANGVFRKRKEDFYNSNQIALIQYSSGTISFSKGVEVTHRNLYLNSLQFIKAFDLNSETHLVSWLHPYHDIGLIGGIIASVFSGIQTTLMAPSTFVKKPFNWLKEISNIKGKVVSGGPNYAFEMCCHKIKDEQLSELDLRHWKVAFNGGEPVKQETLERFINKFVVCGFSPKAFVPVYGITEATSFISVGSLGKGVTACSFSKTLLRNNIAVETPSGGDSVKLTGSGNIQNNYQIMIIDTKSGQKLEDGSVGEILIADSCFALNYYNNIEFTSESFYIIYNGIKFFKTGDLGFVKNDELFITGRLKDLIVLNGAFYYPHHIEYSVSNSHPALRKGCCAAFTVTMENKELLIVVQEISRDAVNKVNLEELLEKIRTEVFITNGIEPHMVCLTFPSSIPKTINGKIQRGVTKVQFLQNTLKVVASRQSVLSQPKEINYSAIKYLPTNLPEGISRGVVTIR
ncbi:MAG: fatty acyl-AMP ligase [Sporocytophaga sp.]|uniref:fatty acyl-AMP ligase n=1 Tax=Sporocytophaga sp. TaxID=2231183 RepID=UPI001B17171F|nr:fatty acyl-AMP ligase [Sporocytophaga sp.]MBO9700991.1 fatty acyl-AMP ligase [Sporocytophaga sp.]